MDGHEIKARDKSHTDMSVAAQALDIKNTINDYKGTSRNDKANPIGDTVATREVK